MLDEAFVRQRRCLNIISLALIAYFATGMQVVLGGADGGYVTVTFRHAFVACVLVWMAFFYFWWRFYLFGKAVQSQWKLDFLFELGKNEKFRKLYAQPEEEGEGLAGQTVWVPDLHGEGFRRYLSWDKAYLVGVKADDGGIQYAEQATFKESINPETRRWNVGPQTVIPLMWHRYAIPALKANLSAMSNKSGTEWALPNFLACTALVSGIAALIIKLL